MSYWGGQFRNPRGIGGRIAARVMNRMNGPLYDAVAGEAGNGADVLDIGFGNGYMLGRLLTNTDSKFFGIDISPDMVKLAAKKNKGFVREGRLTLAEASVDMIPFDKEFDLIYTINTVYFWNDLKSGLAEIYSKLRENGEFLNVCYTKQMLDRLKQAKTYRKYTEEELLEAAAETGFDAEIVPIEEGRSFFLRAVKCRKI
ncbi:MAG: class I SAM-dependent methyltransferase [Methanomassiliicoccaceae archaeon]|nr:class I SAM-dependent methyltransferase [Methanomassiliicoccaceae archaeon]